jgi:hypothetical protein
MQDDEEGWIAEFEASGGERASGPFQRAVPAANEPFSGITLQSHRATARE